MTATASAVDAEYVRALGAADVIDLHAPDRRRATPVNSERHCFIRVDRFRSATPQMVGEMVPSPSGG